MEIENFDKLQKTHTQRCVKTAAFFLEKKTYLDCNREWFLLKQQ